VKLLVDMNLSPSWIPFLERAGFEAIHWSAVGDPRAVDPTVLGWARAHDHVLFTHDLDFGAILAATGAVAPSVIQVRTQDVTPDHLGILVIGVLRQHHDLLQRGAIISVDEGQMRSRILPIK
jgi:predicted nuclease of predicted toxin-antitoxin system